MGWNDVTCGGDIIIFVSGAAGAMKRDLGGDTENSRGCE